MKEEDFRQSLVLHMVKQRGYPLSSLSVECALARIFPCSFSHRWGKKRVDVICMHVWKGEYLPLLVIECKRGSLREWMWHQLLGYNFFLKAPFLILASPQSMELRESKGGEILSGHIPSFYYLKARLKEGGYV